MSMTLRFSLIGLFALLLVSAMASLSAPGPGPEMSRDRAPALQGTASRPV
jgi:hypothetical protein